MAKAEKPAGPVRRNPEKTRQQILDAATVEFAANGYGGTRVNEVALRSGANKRMIYHYFGNKEALFLAVLEQAYATIRASEARLSLADLDPSEGMRKLIGFTFDHFIEHPEFIRLLNSENLHKASHLKRSSDIRPMHSPLAQMIGGLLQRGASSGEFRGDVDPVQLYISMASLAYFYFSNIHTLSTIFGRELANPQALAERRAHMVDVIMGYLRPASGTA